MPDPEVVRLAREHKAAILAQEEKAMREMAARWLKIEQALRDQIEALALEAARMQAEGQIVNRAIVMRIERMQRLLFQVRAQTGEYVTWADEYIADYQALLAQDGLAHAAEAVATSLSEYGIDVSWERLNAGAVENMIGLAGDGSPLERYLRDVHGSAADGMIDALLDGITQGLNPKKIAENMADGLGIGLQKAMNTARTEALRAYRNATLMQYDASGIVVGYKRVSARDGNVCAGCLFTDGQVYDDLSQFEEHNNGRCTLVPILRDVPEPQWDSPFDWFESQDEATQKSILGPGRFEAWKNGASLESMVKRVHDPVWGGAFVPTPVGELNQ